MAGSAVPRFDQDPIPRDRVLTEQDALMAVVELRAGDTGEIQEPARLPLSVQVDEFTRIEIGLTRKQRITKRAMDLSISLIGLLVAAPVLLIIAAVVRVTSRGPALFKHRRVGYLGKSFYVLKFRTMVVDAEARLETDRELRQAYLDGGHKISIAEDPRITMTGRVLRKWSIDELPQLLNVLRGDMSLVGPRPVVPSELAEYRDLAPIYLATRPGLTGYWQVNGRDGVEFPERAVMELENLCNWSPWQDIRLMALTVPTVLRGTS